MKKLLLVICMTLLLTGCSQKVTVDSIQNATSRQDLAKALNCDPSDLKQIINNLNNLYEALPETSDNQKVSHSVRHTDDGEVMIHRDELLSYIEKIDIAEDNWKDICGIVRDKYERKNALGEIEYSNEDIYFGIKEGYVDSEEEWGLKVHDNLNDLDLTMPPFYVFEITESSAENINTYYNGNFSVGDLMYETYDENGAHYYAFDLDNFTFLQAAGYVYKLSIPEEYIYVDEEASAKKVNYYCECKGGILEGHLYIDSGFSIEKLINQD